MISNITAHEPSNKGLIRSIVIGAAIIAMLLFGI
jgi:hypothetical protein